MQTLCLKISDETLRDGEQQAGVFFSYANKKNLAHLIAKAGVESIVIMPAMCETEESALQALISEGLGSIIISATMMGQKYIDQAVACGVKRLTLFHAVSDRLLFLRDPQIRQSPDFKGKTIDDGIPQAVINTIRQNALNKILENLRYATREAGLTVYFAAEDASRADFDYLVECIRSFEPYVDHFMVCDTVGTLSPEKTYIWINDLRQCTNEARLAVHFHNDLGMALENTLQAIIAGASMVSGTFLGIGERAGNVALEQVLNGLRVRFGIEVEGIDYDAIAHVTEYMEQLGVRPAPPYSRASQRSESGIHVNSFLYDRKSYSDLPYHDLEVWFGKGSGASNFQYLFENLLQRPQPRERYEKMRSCIKSLAIQHERSFTAQEVLELFEQGVFDE
ncbi:LeuA family protein [Scytonema sp. NUACC26]|uniref:LeuA family protein n=1 Tax=Scytonema sp. NUACC26 TaxID=3140176 RepID=UPI0034DC383F